MKSTRSEFHLRFHVARQTPARHPRERQMLRHMQLIAPEKSGEPEHINNGVSGTAVCLDGAGVAEGAGRGIGRYGRCGLGGAASPGDPLDERPLPGGGAGDPVGRRTGRGVRAPALCRLPTVSQPVDPRRAGPAGQHDRKCALQDRTLFRTPRRHRTRAGRASNFGQSATRSAKAASAPSGSGGRPSAPN